MLLKLREDEVINTTQIVSITKTNMTVKKSVIRMSNGDVHLHNLGPEKLGDKIAKAEAAADTYYFL